MFVAVEDLADKLGINRVRFRRWLIAQCPDVPVHRVREPTHGEWMVDAVLRGSIPEIVRRYTRSIRPTPAP